MSRVIEHPTAPGLPPAIAGRGLAASARLWRQVGRAWRRDPAGLIGLALTVGGVLMAIFAPLLAPYDPEAQDILNSLAAPSWAPGGAAGHLMGTDQLGRDVLSRVIFGSRVSLSIGFLAVAISAPLGVIIGTLTAYYGGWVEDLVMRLADAQLAIPFLLLALSIVSVLGPGLANVILVLGLAGWVVYARVARAEVLSLKRKEFVEAARAIGAPDARIILRHIVPNTLVPVTVIATFAVAHMILVESSLSFLGLGVPPPTPTWGGMVGDSRNYLTTAWWLPLFPGLAIALTVLGVNFLGDWLRDTLDPRARL